MQLLQRFEAAPAAVDASAPAGDAGLTARRELLDQVLQKLRALKTENERLWAMLEDLLAGDSGSNGSGVRRRNQYVAHLETERAELAGQLAAARREHAEAAARLAAAQLALGKLQGAAHRLSGGTCAPLGLPAPPEQADPAASPAAQQPQASGLSSSASDAATWQEEKRLLKAICKLALAVTMDQVGGRHEAAHLASELEPTMAAHAAMLRTLGLHKVWASLHKLALASGSSRHGGPASHRQPGEASVAEVSLALAGDGKVPADVSALQQRVRHYQASSCCQGTDGP